MEQGEAVIPATKVSIRNVEGEIFLKLHYLLSGHGLPSAHGSAPRFTRAVDELGGVEKARVISP